MPIDGLVWWFPIWLQKELGGQTQPHFQPMQCRKNPPKKNRSLAKGEIRQGTGRKPGSRLFKTNQGCNLGFGRRKLRLKTTGAGCKALNHPMCCATLPKMELSDGIHHINIHLPHIVTTKLATRYPYHYVLCGTPRLPPQKPSTLGPFRAAASDPEVQHSNPPHESSRKLRFPGDKGLAKCAPDLGVLPDVSAWGGTPQSPMGIAPWGGCRAWLPTKPASAGTEFDSTARWVS